MGLRGLGWGWVLLQLCTAGPPQGRTGWWGVLGGGLPDLGVIQRQNTRSSVDHQWGLQDGVCWERISLGVLRQDAFLLLSEGETFMVVLMKCRLACEVWVCPLFTISCLKEKNSLLPDKVTCCFPGKKGWSCSFGDQLGSQSVLG